MHLFESSTNFVVGSKQSICMCNSEILFPQYIFAVLVYVSSLMAIFLPQLYKLCCMLCVYNVENDKNQYASHCKPAYMLPTFSLSILLFLSATSCLFDQNQGGVQVLVKALKTADNMGATPCQS